MNNSVEEYREDYKPHKDFTGLICWQDCREVKLFIYRKLLPVLPYDENKNTGFQIRKSARSVTANIAEGSGRYNYQEDIQYLRIARGSLYELKDDLIFCRDLKYISEETYQEGLLKIEKAKSSTNGFINYLKEQKVKSK
jgi:four helix bundle protein